MAAWRQYFPTLREEFMNSLKKVTDEVKDALEAKEKLRELLEDLLEGFLTLLLGAGSGSSSKGSKSTSNGCVNAQRSALNAPPDVSLCTTFSSYDLLGRTPPNATQKTTLCDPRCFSLLDRLVSMAIPDCGRGFDDKAVDRAVDQLEWFDTCPAIVPTVPPGSGKAVGTTRPSVVGSGAYASWMSIQTATLMIATVVAVAVVV
jgi:hypothetical protein